MIQICQKDKEKAFEAIRTGKIDAAEMSFSNLIDDILLCLAVAAKLKCKTSLTDVPFAVTQAELLAELGWNIWDNERDVNDGLFSERVQNTTILPTIS